MRVLIVEDDFGSRRLMQSILRDVAECDVVVDGIEALEAFRLAWADNSPYDVIFLDIMMPRLDGQMTLMEIRNIERDMGLSHLDEVPVVMTTALDDPKNVIEAYNKGGATAYIVKPIDKESLFEQLGKFGIKLHS